MDSSSPATSSSSTSVTLSEFLDETLAGRLVELGNPIDELGQSFPLFDREKQIENLQERLGKYATQRSKITSRMAKENCRIQVIAGCPGVGKSKFLYHLGGVLPSSCCYIKISYNDGDNPLTFDKEYPVAALCLRILFFGFCRSAAACPTFAQFVDSISARFGLDKVQALTLDTLRISFPTKRGLLVLGIDEFNYVKDDLKDIIPALGSAMMDWNYGFFPILAGTAWNKISEMIKNTSHPFDVITMNPLTPEKCLQLVQDQAWLGEPALTNRPFRKLLSFMGGFPRLIFIFLQRCQEELERNQDMKNWRYTSIYHRVQDEASKRFLGHPVEIAVPLFLSAVTRKIIKRSVVVGNGQTYGQLEEQGLVLLEQVQDSEESYRVRLPLLFAQAMTAQSSGSDPKFHEMQAELHRLCPWNENLPILPPSHFEEIIAMYIALKFSAFYFDGQCTLNSHCTISALINGRCDAKTRNFIRSTLVPLQKPKDYFQLPHQFPFNGVLAKKKTDDPSWEHIQAGKVCWSASGGVADIVFLLDDVLIIGQMKRYTTRDVTTSVVETELEKVQTALGEGSKINWRLVIFGLSECPYQRNTDIPYGVIFVGGMDFREFIGPIIYDQLSMHAFGPLDVNIATAQELAFTLPGIKSTAQDIIDEREKGHFKDWDDFHSRVFDHHTCFCKQLLQDLLLFAS